MRIRKLERRKRAEWIVDYYSGGKRIRKWFRSKALAEAESEALKEQKRTCGAAWVELSPAERSDIMLLHAEARREGVTLRQIWEAFKTGKLDTVPMQRRVLREAIKETIEAKRAENLRERYVNELENYLLNFAAGRNEMFVDRIGVAEIEQWFDQRMEALSTRKSNLGRLGAMFDLCWRRGYIKENPVLRIPAPRLEQVPPKILVPEQAKRLLRTCRKHKPAVLPWLVLGMFAGVRPEELTKLRWRDLDLAAGLVTVDAAASKVRRRRHAPLHETAIAWLKICKPGKPDTEITPPPVTLRRARHLLQEKAKLTWSHDLLRHTAASYLLALHLDAGKVASWLGNSARVLESRYKELVKPESCRMFWALTPSACEPHSGAP